MLINSHDTADDAPWIVPFDRNPRFTGREPQLTKLEEKLVIGDQTTKIAITGLGGVGKTQLVLELVYRTRAKHNNCSIIWIPATNRESLEQAYLDVAKQLGTPGCEEDNGLVRGHPFRTPPQPQHPLQATCQAMYFPIQIWCAGTSQNTQN